MEILSFLAAVDCLQSILNYYIHSLSVTYNSLPLRFFMDRFVKYNLT
jgi:hypothetical protein